MNYSTKFIQKIMYKFLKLQIKKTNQMQQLKYITNKFYLINLKREYNKEK